MYQRVAIALICLFPFCLYAKNGSLKPNSSLAFIENKGQITDQYYKQRKDIDFKLNAPGIDIFIGEGQVYYQWSKSNAAMRQCDNAAISKLNNISPLRQAKTSIISTEGDLRVDSHIETYRLDVTLLGANKNAQLITQEQQEYYENYYTSQLPDGATAHAYQKIIYKNIYPDIDWVLYVANSCLTGGQAKVKNQNSKEFEGLKYDFIVHEGGNPKDIRIKYDGATTISQLDNTSPSGAGGVTITTPFGSITEYAPYSYLAETKQKINSAFILKDNVLSFDIAAYNGELVIDPQLEWATYYGGSGNEVDFTAFLKRGLQTYTSGRIISIDKLGFIYVSGGSSSINNIATFGAFQDTLVGYMNGIVGKFKDDGTRIWSTYFGGTRGEKFGSIVCDSSNNIYVGGISASAGLSTPGVYQEYHDTSKDPLPNKNWDGIIVKFNGAGQRIWTTYYGGNNIDWLENIAIDTANNIYISGMTSSTDNIATASSFMPVIPPNTSVYFLAKLNPAGQRLWGTYLAGSFYPVSVTCDKFGYIYASGHTSGNLIGTPGTYSPSTFGPADAYLIKFNDAGVRQWGTYFGSEEDEYVSNITCDKNGNIYMVGATNGYDSIATPGVYQPKKNPGSYNYDAFIVKIDSSGQRIWGSYFGGPGDDDFYGIAIDNIGDICLAGYTFSTTGIATAGAWKSAVTDTVNGIFVKFNSTGQRLWATFYGGENHDNLSSLAVDASNKVYLAGVTNSYTAISTIGSAQQMYGGSTGIHSDGISDGDIFIIKSDPDSIVYSDYPDTIICINSQGAYINVGYIVSRSFRSGNVFTAQLSDSSGSFANPMVMGSIAATASGFIPCHIPVNIILGNHYRIRVIASAPFYISTDNGKDIEIRNGPEKPIASGDTVLCSGQTLHLFANSITSGATFTWFGPNNFSSTDKDPVVANISTTGTGQYIVYANPVVCKISDTLDVKIFPGVIKPKITVNSPICEGDTIDFHFKADTGVFYNWPWANLHPLKFTDTGTIDIATKDMTGTYIVNALRAGCSNADTAEIFVKTKPALTASSNSPITVGKELQLFAETDSATAFYWSGPDSFNSTQQNPVIRFAGSYKKGTYIVKGVYNGCTATDSVVVVIREGEPYFILFPNPNNGSFTVKGFLKKDQYVLMTVVDAAGQKIWSGETQTTKSVLDYQVTLPQVASGIYQLRLRADGSTFAIPFVVKQ